MKIIEPLPQRIRAQQSPDKTEQRLLAAALLASIGVGVQFGWHISMYLGAGVYLASAVWRFLR